MCLYKFIYIAGGFFKFFINYYILILRNDMIKLKNNIIIKKKKKLLGICYLEDLLKWDEDFISIIYIIYFEGFFL